MLCCAVNVVLWMLCCVVNVVLCCECCVVLWMLCCECCVVNVVFCCECCVVLWMLCCILLLDDYRLWILSAGVSDVPKRRQIKFKCPGITQKKEYNIQFCWTADNNGGKITSVMVTMLIFVKFGPLSYLQPVSFHLSRLLEHGCRMWRKKTNTNTIPLMDKRHKIQPFHTHGWSPLVFTMQP